MPARNWVSFAPVGAGITVVLMLLATGLVNHRNDSACAFATTSGCREPMLPGGFAAPSITAEIGSTDQVAELIRSPAGEDAGASRSLAGQFQVLLEAGPLSLYLVSAGVVLVAVILALLVVVAYRQRRLELATDKIATEDRNPTDRIIKLVENVATVIGALEERTRALESGVKEFAEASAALDKGLAAIAAVLEQIRTDQTAHGELAAETAERLDRAMASTAEELDKFRQTLVDDVVPNMTRRDERLVAIDANLTAITDRLARLGADTGDNARQTAVLAECFRSLESSISELTSGLVETGPSPRSRDIPERPSGVATTPAPAPTPAAAVEPDLGPAAGERETGDAGEPDAAPSEETPTPDDPDDQPPREP